MYTLKVLTVDDEPHICSGIVRVLEKFTLNFPDIEEPVNFEIDTANNGETALEKINQNKPDILLLDYKLPDINGMDVLDRIEAKNNTITTIMITAFASLQVAVNAIKTGAFDFIPKPFTPEELRNVISKAAQNLILGRHVKKLEEEKRKIRFQFISVLGHELKAPLSAIEGYLYMFKDRALGESLNDYDSIINRCLVRTEGMRKLILDILETTKIEAGTRQRIIQDVNICNLVQKSVETFLPDAQKRNIIINSNCEKDLYFSADIIELEMIFNNLISNAIKYNNDNGSVHIDCSKRNNILCIKVKDNGIGMNEEEVNKLFNEFVRIKNEKTRGIHGSGLGLSTLKKIVNLYQGNIQVKSKENEGSEFIIELKELPI